MIRKAGLLAAAGLILTTFGTRAAKADDIVFAGGAGGSVALLGTILDPNAHELVSSTPLATLTINGTTIASFSSGTLNIDTLGDAKDSSGNLLFSTGTLSVLNSGSVDELTSTFLGGTLGMVSGVPTFIGVLDPSTTVFSDLLASQGPLLLGLGVDQLQLEIPVISLPVVGFAGTAEDSGVELVTAPEPANLLLFGTGVAALLILLRKRQTRIAAETA